MKRINCPCPVVLASASPERRRLLNTICSEFEVVRPRVNEEVITASDPEALASRRAEAKALDVARQRPGSLVIAADTLVACGESVIGKPIDHEDAVCILRQLSSHPHRVITAVCVVGPQGELRTDTSVTTVRLRKMSDDEIREYIRKQRTLDKAGAYALQREDPNVLSMEGSVTGVMGLPLEKLRNMMESL